MTEPFVEMLKGGHHNSLGRTDEVIEIVLADQARLEELFGALRDPDELVRMRAGDALEKVCAQRPAWFVPEIDRLLDEVAQIDQPSVQWHVVQMLQHLRTEMSPEQAASAEELLNRYLTVSGDWIVLNNTMDVLAEWAGGNSALTRWLKPELERLSGDRRKSVAKRAGRHLRNLST